MEIQNNSFNRHKILELQEALEMLRKQQTTISKLIVCGKHHFCTGADLMDDSIMSKGGGKWMNEIMTAQLKDLAMLPFTTYSFINTLAVGGGAELACATDYRIMTRNAYIQFVHSNYGIIPGWGGYQLLSDICGHSKAVKILMNGYKLYPKNCEELGLVDAVVESKEKFLKKSFGVEEKYEKFDLDCPIVDNSVIKALRKVRHKLSTESEMFQKLWMSNYHKNKINQFKQK